VHDGAHDAARHADEDMSGLILGIHVSPRAGATPPAADTADDPARHRHRLRIVVTEKPRVYRQHHAYSFVRADGGDPAPDSLEIPGRALVLTRGQPVQVTVVNRTAAPTAVHWHGIELESYFDGVAGFGGLQGSRLAPLIAPADSFAVRFTPPRAGTFIYHAHVDDQRQIALGLYGPLIVLEPGATLDPATDHVLLISQLGLGQGSLVGLNGTATPAPLELTAGTRHRLRFINIAIQDLADVRLLRADSTLVHWRALAKDGRDLAPRHAVRVPAALLFGPGETYDFELSLPSGDYRLTVDSFNDFVVPVRVR
jgi:manganese oxidase